MLRGGGDGTIEGIYEGGVEGAEGELVDDVGEVEGCLKRSAGG